MEIKKNAPFILGISLPILMIIFIIANICLSNFFTKHTEQENQTQEIEKKENQIQEISKSDPSIPSITVVSPVLGEVLYANTEYRIGWKWNGDIDERVNVLIKQFDESGVQVGDWSIIVNNVLLSNGYYDWNPISDPLYSTKDNSELNSFGAGRFKIKIMEAHGNVFAISDFFIINDEIVSSEDYCKSITGGDFSVENGEKYCTWDKKIFEGGCAGSNGEGSQYCDDKGSGSKVLNLPVGFKDVVIKSFAVDDSGDISVNGVHVYSTGPGCAMGNNSLNKNISPFFHQGVNDITVNVSNDCGLSMGASLKIKFNVSSVLTDK